MIDQLIQNISPAAIANYFQQTISSFKPDTEDLSDLLREKDFEQFNNLQKIGEVEYPDSDELIIFSCKFIGELSSRSSKKKQYDIAKKLLKEDFKDGAIFIFYDEAGRFRFSFIRKHYGDKEKRYSNWKRYTYFVDPNFANRTFRKRVGDCAFLSLDEIMEAFSVEPLNKEFYEKIVRAFYSLVGGEIGSGRNKEKLKSNLTLPGGNRDRNSERQFGVRLIGRIIFCWFLKHKKSGGGIPLIPEDWLSSQNINGDYYHQKLELLFFEILNTPFENRISYLPENHKTIPFLNGGLFESQIGKDNDYYESAKKSVGQRSNPQLKISDKWFKELFEVLEQYNFTIDENSINDAEVSIDPEMLGRIFENLLAEIDPNLKDSEKTSVRKATGSYYTPREIVDYMVEEALMKYLNNKTGISERALHHLFLNDGIDRFSEGQKEDVIEAINQVKILDPAAGSGAFPMGCLHKITTALQKLDPGAEKWKEKQLAKISNAYLKDEMKAILDKSNAEYTRKLGVLQQCIYGADIQPIAAEISRLRSFLSLIVEEEISDIKYNRGIVALPNLEFKFVTANTLVKLEHGRVETHKVIELIPKLHLLRQDYLQAHGNEKEQLRKEFTKIQNEIFEDQLKFDKNDPDMNSRAMQLANWDPFKNEITNWFDPEWMFGVKQFDIVIGNPPYGGTKITEALKTKLGLGSKDPYGAFMAKYLRKKQEPTLLKHEGILAFIVSDTFMTIKSHKPLRDYILDNRIHSIVRVHPDTFKATVNTAVIFCERREQIKKGDIQTLLAEITNTSKREQQKADDNRLLMADFTNTSIHEQHDRFIQLLDKITDYTQPEYEEEAFEENNILYMKGDDWTSESSEEYAVYTYPQTLILRNSIHPFFVASPKLFDLMNDTKVPKKLIKIDGKEIQIRYLMFNGEFSSCVKLGQIAHVKRGMDTGKNEDYLYQFPEVRGNYNSINPVLDNTFSRAELETLIYNEKIRRNVVDEGFSEYKNELPYFKGKFIIPFDKGGESDSGGGWIPNYYVPSKYFINWSKKSVKSLYERAKFSTAKANLRNPDFWFKDGITYSARGVYSPSFRLNSFSVFDSNGSSIFFSSFKSVDIIGLLTSKGFKYFLKNFCGHTVATEVDELKECYLSFENLNLINFLVKNIILKQTDQEDYKYESNEQLEIDYLNYNSYKLNWDDIKEIENWYARRYPKLSVAQKRNLAELGKPTDYIEIYKGLEEKYGGSEE